MPTDRPCPKCSIKHLGQAKACAKLARLLLAEARVLGFESLKGYPHHYWDAMGHMAQAEDEILAIMPAEAEAIRKARKLWEDDPRKVPDLKKLMYVVNDGAMLGNPLKNMGDRDQMKMFKEEEAE